MLSAPTPKSMATCFTSVPVRSLIVMLSASAQGIELDALDTVEIHNDVALRAGERRPGAIGGDADVLATLVVVAVEDERVEAGSALDLVTAVAGFQMNVSLPAPRNAVSVPLPPTTVSSPRPPSRVSLPSPPLRVSLPLPPNSWSGPVAAGQHVVAVVAGGIKA